MDTDTRLGDLGQELVLVIRRIAIATERQAEAQRELTAAVAHKARLEQDITRLSSGQLYGEPSAGRLSPPDRGERTRAIRAETILKLSDPVGDEVWQR